MIYKDKPENFNPKLEAVGCFVQCDGDIILLHRQDHKPQGNTWGIPSGKVDSGENPKITALRETEEETGIKIPENKMTYFSTVYVRFQEYDFVYHMYHANLKEKSKIKISNREHKGAKWIAPGKAMGLPLIEDLDGCIKMFFGI
jgi:8-oxo-dGTP pyrophosphatase MutT (NUDIX family)